MQFDVEKVISNCKENHCTVLIEHSVQATFSRNVGERVGIDLVFGLPLSEDGFMMFAS